MQTNENSINCVGWNLYLNPHVATAPREGAGTLWHFSLRHSMPWDSLLTKCPRALNNLSKKKKQQQNNTKLYDISQALTE
jgi:hypothetical protein